MTLMADNPLYGLGLRELPSNVEAEQALLGAMLANNRAYERVCEFLLPEHFADPINGTIYTHIADRILEGHTADAVTLKGDFENSGVLDEVGGTAYLARLLAAMVGIIQAGEYGRAVLDAWLRRQLISVGSDIINRAFGADPKMDAVRQIETAERALADIASGGRRSDRMVSLGDAVSAAIAQAQAIYAGGPSPAVLSGISAVDNAFGGFWPKNLILLAGIPGAGKTALATQIADAVAQRLYDQAIRVGATPLDGYRQPGVALFSLEMTAEELGMRVAAYRARISVEKMLRGDLDLDVASRLARAEREVRFLPLRIHDCRGLSLKLLGAKVRMHLQRQPEVLVVVDHLLVLEGEQTKRSSGNGNDAASVAAATRDLKKLAGDTGLPFVILTHATRASAARTNPRPMQSDVKWAGEGDADVLVFVHRPVMFLDGQPPASRDNEHPEKYEKRRNRWYTDRDQVRELAELVVAKRRMGPPGVWRMRWDGPTTSFSEWVQPIEGAQSSWVP